MVSKSKSHINLGLWFGTGSAMEKSAKIEIYLNGYQMSQKYTNLSKFLTFLSSNPDELEQLLLQNSCHHDGSTPGEPGIYACYNKTQPKLLFENIRLLNAGSPSIPSGPYYGTHPSKALPNGIAFQHASTDFRLVTWKATRTNLKDKQDVIELANWYHTGLLRCREVLRTFWKSERKADAMYFYE